MLGRKRIPRRDERRNEKAYARSNELGIKIRIKVKNGKLTTRKSGEGSASGSAPTLAFDSFCFLDGFDLTVLACACRGGAQHRHLYQDKHTPKNQMPNFCLFFDNNKSHERR